ncbi:MAG: tetratricopeptide repeat protein, partial [Promethearchaeota archaeon]
QEIDEGEQLISESTLSNYLKKLDDDEYIIKKGWNHYEITEKGKNRFNTLSLGQVEDKKPLNYPPEIIRRRRNYDHWILWMVYNNSSCRWSDFNEKDNNVFINNSSLSKNLNSLIESGYVRKEEGEYKITESGKIEYSRMLKSYDLDRQAILEEESKRIEEITKKTNDFFDEYGIEDDKIKFRFLNTILKLNYSKVENLLKNRDDFNKIVLFLSINHPYYYPEYITIERFAHEFDIKKTTLEFFIDKIVEEDYFNIKFFKLIESKDKIYYFKVNDKIERSLRVIVDDYITRFTYLNKLYENLENHTPNIILTNIIDQILAESCGLIIHMSLKDSLKSFIPEYLKYLAYKIETEKKLTTDESKLESLIWQTISEEFQGFEKGMNQTQNGTEDHPYDTDRYLLETLDVTYLSKLYYVLHPEFLQEIEIDDPKNFNHIIELINSGEIQDAETFFNSENNKLNHLEKLVLEDIIATVQGEFKKSLKISQKIIQKYDLLYIGYLFQSITSFLMGEYGLALDQINKGIEKRTNASLKSHKVQILMKLGEKENALKLIEENLSQNQNDLTFLRLMCLYNIVDQKCYMDTWKEVFNAINNLIEDDPNNEELKILKSILLFCNSKYKGARNLIDEYIDFNPLHKKPSIHTSAYFVLVYSYIAEGKFQKALEIANLILILYPNNPKSYLIKAVVIGYSLIFNNQNKDINSEIFQALIYKAISLDPIKSNQALYLQYESIILAEVDELNKAIEIIDQAINLFPERSSFPMKKAYLLTNSDMEKKALELLDELIVRFPSRRVELYRWKSFIFFKIKDFEKGLDALNNIIDLAPEDKKTLNNKALILAKLNKRKEALETIEHVVSLFPEDGNSFDSYGEILMELGEYQKAITKLEKAIELEPKGWFISETYKKMAKCYEELDNEKQAKLYFRKVEEIKKKMLPLDRDVYED